MGSKMEDIEKVGKMNLVSLNRKTRWVIRIVTILVKPLDVAVYRKMMVLDAELTYNAILEIKAIHSTYHKMIKFLVRGWIEKLCSDQVYAWSRLVTTMKEKNYGDK